VTEVGKAGLQSQITKLLDRLRIVYVRSRTDKRSTTQPGTPDFIFSVWGKGVHGWCVVACAWEVKLPKGKLRPDQEKMRLRMVTPPNTWRYSVITSLDEAISELKAIGI
jgi:hypothetical protein